MALKLTKTTTHGLEAVDAYHRVENLSIKNKTSIEFVVRSYTSPDKPAFADMFVFCAYDLDGENPIKQAYKYLKTLPDFETAVNC